MQLCKLLTTLFTVLGGSLFLFSTQVFANGDSSCDDECVLELRQMIEAQQQQLQQQAALLSTLQQRVDSISAAPVVDDAKNQPGVVQSGGR